MNARFVKQLPNCELHLHIEGCLEPELMFKFARRNKLELKFKTANAVKRAYKFNNLQSFLDLYYEGARVLRTEQDFYDLAWSYFAKAAEQNVRHAEIFFDPQTHTERGVPFETVLNGIWEASKDADRKFGVSSYLILCFLRHLDADAAMKTLRQAIPYREKIIGVGLDSSERRHPPAPFKKVFDAARRKGFVTFAHAGEEGPASYVRDAFEILKVRRIDHGVRSLEDPKLVKELVAKRVPLTVCPLSNVRLKVVPNLAKHPLKKMLKAGLFVTVNSDDPAYFGGYVNENLIAVQKALRLTEKEIVLLARNSVEASLLPDREKAVLLREIDAYSEL